LPWSFTGRRKKSIVPSPSHELPLDTARPDRLLVLLRKRLAVPGCPPDASMNGISCRHRSSPYSPPFLSLPSLLYKLCWPILYAAGWKGSLGNPRLLLMTREPSETSTDGWGTCTLWCARQTSTDASANTIAHCLAYTCEIASLHSLRRLNGCPGLVAPGFLK